MAPTPQTAQGPGPLPPPWDRIFSLGTRVFVWALIFGILYVLRPFFLLVFLTFVFAYILEHGVQGLAHRIANRPARVVLVALVFLGTLITLGVALAPAFQQQARKLAAEYPQYLAKIDTELDRTREQQPEIFRI
ncbi:MAG: AI-2E family transporter, partial [Planctomycetota bacterium]